MWTAFPLGGAQSYHPPGTGMAELIYQEFALLLKSDPLIGIKVGERGREYWWATAWQYFGVSMVKRWLNLTLWWKSRWAERDTGPTVVCYNMVRSGAEEPVRWMDLTVVHDAVPNAICNSSAMASQLVSLTEPRAAMFLCNNQPCSILSPSNPPSSFQLWKFRHWRVPLYSRVPLQWVSEWVC